MESARDLIRVGIPEGVAYQDSWHSEVGGWQAIDFCRLPFAPSPFALQGLLRAAGAYTEAAFRHRARENACFASRVWPSRQLSQMAMLTHVNAVPVWLYQMPVHTEYAEYTPSRAVAHRSSCRLLRNPAPLRPATEG